MSIIDVAYALTAPVEAVVFFMMFDTFFERRRKFPAWQYIIGICVLTFLFAAVNNIFLYRLGNLVGMIFFCCFGFYFLLFYNVEKENHYSSINLGVICCAGDCRIKFDRFYF